MIQLIDRIFEGLPALRAPFDAGTLTSYDIRTMLQAAYSLGGADMLKLQSDYWKRPKTVEEKN